MIFKNILKSILPSQMFWIPRYYLLRKRLDCENNGLTLDAGCGEGIVTIYLAKKGLKIIGVDVSEGQIRQSRLNCEKDIFILADLSHLPFRQGVFDLIFSLDVLEYKNITDLRKIFLEFYRLLKPQARLMISVKREYISSAKLFVLQGMLRKLLPRFLYAYDLSRGKIWFDSTVEDEMQRLGNIYSLDEVKEKSKGLFSISYYEDFMKLFTSLSRDVVYGIKGFYYLRFPLFFIAVRIEHYFFKKMRGYCTFLELKRLSGILYS